MLIRSLKSLALCVALCSVAFAQSKTYLSIPFAPSGDSAAAWSSSYGAYPQGAVVMRGTQLCLSLKFNNTGDPSTDTTDWACSAIAGGSTAWGSITGNLSSQIDLANALAAKAAAFTLTTNNTSGPATLNGGVLNIPQYQASTGGASSVGGAGTPMASNGSGGFQGASDVASRFILPGISAGASIFGAAFRNIGNDTVRFTDGTKEFQAAPLYGATWVADTSYAMLGIPDAFSDADVTSYIQKLVAAKAPNPNSNYPVPSGSIPINLASNGQPIWYCDGYDSYCHHPSLEGIFGLINLELLHYQKSGSITQFNSDASTLDTALSLIPVDGNGIPYITPGDEWVDNGFEESIRKTGETALGAVGLYHAATLMNQLASVAGNSSLANKYSAIAAKIAANMGTSSAMWDSGDGAFYMGTLQNKVPSNEASALFCQYQVPSPNLAAQCSAIGNYFVNNVNTIMYQGFFRRSNQNVPTVGELSSGGAPYTSNDPRDAAGCYQGGGYWTDFNRGLIEAAYAVSPSTAATMMQAYQATPDLTMEYLAPSCSNGGPQHGFTNNLESPAGNAYAASEFPGITSAASAAASPSGNAWPANSSGIPQLTGSGASEVGDVQNTNPAGYSSFSLLGTGGSTAAIFGFGNASVSQTQLRNTAYFGGVNTPVCIFTALPRCDISIAANGQVTISNLAGSNAVSYGNGTPTSSTAQVTFPASPWQNTDSSFLIIIQPTSSVSAGTPFVTITMGSSFPHNPMCVGSPFANTPDGLIQMTDSNINGGTHVTFSPSPGMTLSSGATYYYIEQCK